MDPEKKADLLRFGAAYLEMHAARLRMAAAAVTMTASFERLAAVMQGGFDDELAQHPDMAELNVRMDALYG